MPRDKSSENMTFDPGPPPTVNLSGDLDLNVTEQLRSLLRRAEETPGNLRINLEDVTYVDSSGWAVLIDHAMRLSSSDRKMVLLRPLPGILHTLRLAGLNRYFEIQDPGTPVEQRELPVSTSPGWQHSSFSIPCRVNLLSMARERVMTLAQSLPFSEDELCEIELAVGEALSNALRHGCTDPEQQIMVECESSGPGLILEVTDPGGGFQPDIVPVPLMEALQEGGMGLFFMRLMMDEVTYKFDERGTTVRMLKQPKPI